MRRVPGQGPEWGPAPQTIVSRNPDPQEAGLWAQRGAWQPKPSLSPGAQGSGCGAATLADRPGSWPGLGLRTEGCQDEEKQIWVEMLLRRER